MSSLIRRIIAMIISLISALSFGGSAARLPERNLYPVAEGQMRVMSFNIKYKYDAARFKKVAELIGDYLPDSVGLQECKYDCMTLFKTQLPEYGFIGVGRDNGKLNANGGETAGILYRKDTYTVTDSGTFWLSDTPDVPSKGWDGDCTRICTWAILKNKQTGETYAHVNTHLDHIGAQAQKNGMALVLEKVRSFNIPTVLTGDFNVTEESALFKDTLKNSGLIYTRTPETETEPVGFTFHDYKPESQTSPYIIDHIWVNSMVYSVNKYKIITDTIDGKVVSDHYPVIVDLTLSNPVTKS